MLIFVQTKIIINLLLHDFRAGDDVIASAFCFSKLNECPCFYGAETASVTYSLNVIDEFIL